MPKNSPNKPCRWAHEPETKEQRRARLDVRRANQRSRFSGYFVEEPDARKERTSLERRTQQMGGEVPRRTLYLLKVGKTYDRRGKC